LFNPLLLVVSSHNFSFLNPVVFSSSIYRYDHRPMFFLSSTFALFLGSSVFSLFQIGSSSWII
jgi:hypothetical protein